MENLPDDPNARPPIDGDVLEKLEKAMRENDQKTQARLLERIANKFSGGLASLISAQVDEKIRKSSGDSSQTDKHEEG